MHPSPWRASPSRRRRRARAGSRTPGPGGDEAQGPAHRARAQAAGRDHVPRRCTCCAPTPRSPTRTRTTSRARRHSVNPYDPGAPAASVCTGGGSTSGTSSPRRARARAARTSRAPGRTCAGRGRCREGKGVTVAVLDTGVAYRSKGTDYSRDPDLPPVDAVRQPEGLRRRRQLAARRKRPRHPRGEHDRARRPNNDRGLDRGRLRRRPDADPRPRTRDGTGTASNIARGIRYAVGHGADVINLSLEFQPAVRQCSQIPGVLHRARVRDAQGVVVVAAAGNQADAERGLPRPRRRA